VKFCHSFQRYSAIDKNSGGVSPHFCGIRDRKLRHRILSAAGISDCHTSTVADDRVFRSVDHRRGVDRWKSAVYQLKLVRAKQRRPDRLDLDVGESLADAAVTASAERHVTELLFITSSLQVQESDKEQKLKH